MAIIVFNRNGDNGERGIATHADDEDRGARNATPLAEPENMI